jgi:hypothetical protein
MKEAGRRREQQVFLYCGSRGEIWRDLHTFEIVDMNTALLSAMGMKTALP